MNNQEFDWTEILPEPDRSKVRAAQQDGLVEFIDSFPTKEEIEQAGVEGRASLANACATVDARKETERLLNAAMDHIAGTLEQPSDPRAWMHLLIYCPYDILEAAYVSARLRRNAAPLSRS